MTRAVLDHAQFETFESPIRVHPRATSPLVARLVPPQRELQLRRSWMIGGYGRAMPRPWPVDAGEPGRRLLRPYELRLDQIVADAPAGIYELREDQILRA